MTLVAAARADLFAALTAAFAGTPWRVHQWTPSTIAAPAVWIDSAQRRPDGPFVLATFPVVVVVDGHERRQVEQLDDMVDVAWDAIGAADGEHEADQPASVDVGGPSLRATVLTAVMPITAVVLCPDHVLAPEGVTA